MNILDIAIAKKLAGGGGGSGTDNYNDLSNLPKINDVTLSGNKSSSALGLQSEITSENKLDSDLIDDTDQDNKFVTSSEKNMWNAKQNAIDADHKLNADYVDDSTSTNKFVTASDKEAWNAKQNAIDNSHKLSSDLVDDANHTNKFVTSTEKNTWNGKQNAIDSEHKLSSSLVSFTTAEAAALASGIDSTKVAQISTNQSNILSVADANGQKNLIFYDGFPKTEVGVTLSFDDNGGIELNGTCGGTDDYAYIYGIYAYVDAGTVYSFIDSMYTGSEQYAFVAGSEVFDNPPAFISSVNNRTAKISGKVTIVIRLTKGITYNKTKIYPMLCAKSQFDISPAYQPYSLPNTLITPELIELVDSGAKNKFDLANATLTDISTTTHTRTASTLSVETTGVYGRVVTPLALKKGNYVFHVKISSYSPHTSANKAALSICSDTLGTDTAYGFMEVTANGEYTINFTLSNDATVYIAFTANNTAYAVSPAESFVASEIMVCTKAAFGVSSKFVPYRPNYDLVCGNALGYTITQTSTSFSNVLANAMEPYYFKNDYDTHTGMLFISTDVTNEYYVAYFSIDRGQSITIVKLSNNVIDLSAYNDAGSIVLSGGTAPYTLTVKYNN